MQENYFLGGPETPEKLPKIKRILASCQHFRKVFWTTWILRGLKHHKSQGKKTADIGQSRLIYQDDRIVFLNKITSFFLKLYAEYNIPTLL